MRIMITASLLLLAGCSPSYTVVLDNYLDTGAQIGKGAKIALLPPNDTGNRIRDKQIQAKMEALLVKQGFTLAPPESAEFLLGYRYGMGSEVVSGTQAFYVPGQSVSSTISSFNGSAVMNSQSSGTVQHVPVQYTEYDRWLSLELRRTSKRDEPVWMSKIVSSGSSSDLRHVLNILLFQGFRYFGQDTKKQVSDSFKDYDARIIEVESL